MKDAAHIEGFMSEKELEWLTDQAVKDECRVAIEIGSWKGRSAAAILEGGVTLFCIDNYGGDGATKEARDAFLENLKDFIHRGRCFLVENDSTYASLDLERILKFRPADMAFVDGNHDTTSARNDIKLYRQLLRPGGLLCGHDYDLDGVKKAVDELLPNRQLVPNTTIWFDYV